MFNWDKNFLIYVYIVIKNSINEELLFLIGNLGVKYDNKLFLMFFFMFWGERF